jgi:cobalt/nickel transport system permease protein
MHIPDGYLSPSTCAVLYGASAPFWYIALQRVKRLLATRLVPLLAVMAALSFVIMMFNLPLPGGTTGHAVGMAVTTIILGPWASILAISMALLIQAVFFGDGGLTTLGANCFNMAIVGSLVAYAVYRWLAGRAGLTSPRRVVAAALAGYAAINASAFCAAVEFGIQPHFFKDPSGAPLYAPYPLSIAIPAMMIGHLTFAGFAELILSAGVVAYFQKTNPSLLLRTAPAALTDVAQGSLFSPAASQLGSEEPQGPTAGPALPRSAALQPRSQEPQGRTAGPVLPRSAALQPRSEEPQGRTAGSALPRSAALQNNAAGHPNAWQTARPLWIALALLLVLTPLGILAAGSAWGEWSARDFSSSQAREKMALASQNQAPPAQPPRGLKRLSSLWSAPFPQYAPSFVRRPDLGYALSAMFGSGAIILVFLFAGSLATRVRST